MRIARARFLQLIAHYSISSRSLFVLESCPMAETSPRSDARLDFRALYRQAFDTFGAAALWNKARIEDPTPEHALVIAKALRTEGNRQARELAEQIERAVASVLGAA